jgi:AcrR family transcriptional regulator
MPPEKKEINSAPDAAQDDTRQKIIDAAADVFTKNGYARTTTKSIAKAAGVSEVTLFRHFETKENLMSEAMEAYGSPFLVRTIEGRLTGDYREDIRLMGRFFMKAVLERSGAILFAIGESRHFPGMRKLFSKMPEQLWQMLARYLQKKMDEGVVRKLHPSAAAQAFFGMFFAYAVSWEAVGLGPEPEITALEAADQIADIFVEGTVQKSEKAVTP